MKFPIHFSLVALASIHLVTGCSVFRKTAVDSNVAVSRDLTLQGLAANYNNNRQQAETYFTSAVNADPDNVEARMLLAQSYRDRGQVAPAIDQLEESIRIAPDKVDVICMLGECYSVSKREKQAYRLSELALRKDRESVPAWTLKAQTLWRMGAKEKALADFQRALRIDPGNQELRRQMAVLYQELGKPLRALTTLDKIANEYDEAKIPEEILLRQSVALRELDRNSEAVNRLKIGFDRGNYSEQLAANYLTALVQENDFETASRVMKLATTRFPEGNQLAMLRTNLRFDTR